jgi:hypothetical protein
VVVQVLVLTSFAPVPFFTHVFHCQAQGTDGGNEHAGAERQGFEEGNSGPVGRCVGLCACMPNRRVTSEEWLVG